MTGTAKNVKTGEERPVKLSVKQASKLICDSVDKCTGKCKCTIEPDGTCPNGWPSRLIALHLI